MPFRAAARNALPARPHVARQPPGSSRQSLLGFRSAPNRHSGVRSANAGQSPRSAQRLLAGLLGLGRARRIAPAAARSRRRSGWPSRCWRCKPSKMRRVIPSPSTKAKRIRRSTPSMSSGSISKRARRATISNRYGAGRPRKASPLCSSTPSPGPPKRCSIQPRSFPTCKSKKSSADWPTTTRPKASRCICAMA